MKHLPRAYPIAFALLIAVLFSVGVWSIAESAVNGREPLSAAPSVQTASSAVAVRQKPRADFEWYEHAAIFVCPLH